MAPPHDASRLWNSIVTPLVHSSSAFVRPVVLRRFRKASKKERRHLFSPASNLIHDVYKRFVAPHASERRTLLVSRALVVFLGVFALLQAAHFESILRASLYAYTVYGAAVTPAVMAVFFWKRATTTGAITSIALGAAITIIWNVMDIQIVDAVYPALGVSVLGLVVVSLVSPPPPAEKWKPFFERAEGGIAR